MIDTSKKIQAVLFDLGGVLIDWNPRYLFRKVFIDDHSRMEHFLQNIANQEWNEKQDEGRPIAEAIADLVARHPEFEQEARLYFARWPEMLGGAIEGTVEIMRELKEAGVPLYALSNWSAETFHHAQAKFEFLKWFIDIGVSGHEKIKKPDPKFYRLVLKRNKLLPEQILFIDDVQANIEAAKAIGLKAILFTSPEKLRQDLLASGLPIRRR